MTGVDLEGDLSVGADGSLTGTADLDLTATAVTVGDDASSDQVVARAGNGSAVNTGLAFDSQDQVVSIGANGTVVGDADADLSASATGVAAGVSASALLDEAVAIDLGSASSTTLMSGGDLTITADSLVNSTATASTTDGSASANSDTFNIAGLGEDGGFVQIGSSGVVDADAVGVGVATASSIDAGTTGSVTATVNQDYVEAIDLGSASGSGGGLTSGSTLSVDADASSTQTATAKRDRHPWCWQ